jgi:hypothetical protein
LDGAGIWRLHIDPKRIMVALNVPFVNMLSIEDYVRQAFLMNSNSCFIVPQRFSAMKMNYASSVTIGPTCKSPKSMQ